MGAFTGQNLVLGGIGGDQNGGEKSRPTAWDGVTPVGYGDGGGGIPHIVELSKCADCVT